MSLNSFLIVDKRILPDYYQKVVETQPPAFLRSGEGGQRRRAHDGHFAQHLL